MKPVDFGYTRPADVNGVLAALAREPAAKIIAGGQSLGPMLNLRLVQPGLLIDISSIEQLRTVSEGRDSVVLGACVTHADCEDGRVPDVTNGALRTVAAGIAYRAVRNRGTIGGSLTHADPSADWISLLSALGASVTLAGPSGTRTIASEAYILGALQADLRDGEMLVSVTIPKLSATARWGYYKLCRKTGEFAHAIGAFLTDPDRGVSRAVFGATGGRPIVLADATEVIGDGRGAVAAEGFNLRAAEAAIARSGPADPIERQLHVVALRRALERAKLQ